jgi:two-component system sensor histidine kinase CreC
LKLFVKLVAVGALLIAISIGLNGGLSLWRIPRHFWTPMEEGLNDSANLLAAMVSSRMESEQIGDLRWLEEATGRARDRSRSANGQPVVRTRENLRILVTDAAGLVLYDSLQEDIGKVADWRDIVRALRGEYGARSTPFTMADGRTAFRFFVAAPIEFEQRVVGAVSVGKTTAWLRPYINTAKRRLLMTAAISLVLGIGLLLYAYVFIGRPYQQLVRYVRLVGADHKASLPVFRDPDIGHLGRIIHGLRQTLETKQRLQEYVEGVTHQLKGVLHGICQNASLLRDGRLLGDARRTTIDHVVEESKRMARTLDGLTQLSEVEILGELTDRKAIRLPEIVAKARAICCDATALAHPVRFTEDVPDVVVRGSAQLLPMALGCLLRNAIEFSPPNGVVEVSGETTVDGVSLHVQDRGPGIPEHALDKIFLPVFSTARPDTKRKSSGVGLCIAQRIARAHGGEVRLRNRDGGGAVATLHLPC